MGRLITYIININMPGRNPSLHIKKSDLILVLKKLLSSNSTQSVYCKELADQILRLGKPYSITTRSISITNDRLEKKAKQITSSSRLDADLFSNLLFMLRKKNRHRGITQYKPGCKDWEVIKELAEIGNQFANDFGIENKKEAYTTFIRLTLGKMNQFNLHKFKTLYQVVSEEYGATGELAEMDKTPGKTQEVLDYYNKIILGKTGMDPFDYSKTPDKYLFFFKVKEICESKNIPIRTYIDAQFEGLAFANGIPQPGQLVGPKAEERLIKYMYENNVKVKNTAITTVDWDKIKNAK
jgi:hypothetical protein